MALIDTTDATFETDVLSAPTPVIVDFWSKTCAPCKAIAPILEKISETYGEEILIAKIDIDENPDTAIKYSVRGAPVLKFFNQGDEKASRVGAAPKSMIVGWINTQLEEAGIAIG